MAEREKWKPGMPKPDRYDPKYPPGEAGQKLYDEDDFIYQQDRDSKLPKAHTGSQNTGRTYAEMVEQDRVAKLNAKLSNSPKPAPSASPSPAPSPSPSPSATPKPKVVTDAKPTPPAADAGLSAQAEYHKQLREWNRRDAASKLKAGKQAEAVKK